MTKPAPEQAKLRKTAKTTEQKVEANEDSILNESGNIANEIEDGEDSLSSILTDEDEEVGVGGSSGEDTDQLMSRALDTVLKQATESKIVIPPTLMEGNIAGSVPQAVGHRDNPSSASKNEVDDDVTPKLDVSIAAKDSAEAVENENSSPAARQPLRKSGSRKLEVERRRQRREKKLSRERRERIRAKVARQVAELAAATAITPEVDPPQVPLPKIPKVSAARSRQISAVAQTRNHGGLSSRYSNLSKLIEFHRFLLKGNPFALIEPKQVYPHFHLIPGINSAIVQPLVRAWQEKATKILYQLLIIETKGDIARIKKRTFHFGAEPALFTEAFALKVDIGLEKEVVQTAALEAPPSLPGSSSHTPDPRPPSQPIKDVGQPPIKKSKRFTSAFPV